jgi:hypothetical protein
MCKYVLTHQLNLISLYALGHLHAPREPIPPREAADRRLKAYPGGYRGATDRVSNSPPDPAPDSPQKTEPGSPWAVGLGSPPDPTSVSPLEPTFGFPPEPASVSRPAGSAGTRNLASHYQCPWRRSILGEQIVWHISPKLTDHIMTLSRPASSHMTR